MEPLVQPVQAKRRFGQHFLADPTYCHRVVRFASICATDRVVEIGPGTGNLTEFLIAAASRVTVLEIDPDMIPLLRQRFGPEPKLEIIQTDILQFDWSSLRFPEAIKVVGNLPYNISTRLLQMMTHCSDRFHSFTFMVQKEVADRILAPPRTKEYGFLTLLLAFYFDRLRGFDVPPGAFSPKPKVQSYVLKLVPWRPMPESSESRSFVRLISAAFRQRRKTLWNNLRTVDTYREGLEEGMEACGIFRTARPEELTLEDFLSLNRVLSFADDRSARGDSPGGTR